MKNINNAFSLIEVIVASVILSIAVFGVFKLIGENQKLINNSDNYKTTTSLFIPFQECIENIFGNSKSTGQHFYLNLENCGTGSTQTGIILDNIEYILYGSGSDLKNFKLKIDNGFLNLEKEYRLLK